MSEDIHKYPSQLAERFQVRMPDGLRDKLRDAAAANSRSMNSEIVARLEESFETTDHDMSDAVNLLRIQYRVILDLLEESGKDISKDLREDMERLAYSKNHKWKPYEPSSD